MAKTITIDYNNKSYTLEYTRSSVKMLEASGFTVQGIVDAPVTNIPRLFFGAFKANHPSIKSKLTDEIYESLGQKSDLVSKLIEMYTDTIEALTGNDEDSENEGNASWEADF